jgi:hypothetical protein
VPSPATAHHHVQTVTQIWRRKPSATACCQASILAVHEGGEGVCGGVQLRCPVCTMWTLVVLSSGAGRLHADFVDMHSAGAISTAQVGLTGKAILPVACFDANAKANRYRSAGKASSTSFEQLPTGRFFAQADADVWKYQAAGGGLPLSSTGSSGIGSSSGSGADDADLELESAMQDDCHPHLTCARDTSQCSSISDVCGVAAGVCAHGQPLAGCALAMPAPERFLYYDLIVAHLLTQADVQLMYIDTGCSYAAHWRLHMPADAAPAVIKIPWWHARGHGASCFLKNSGLYLPGEPGCAV